ncbi:MAG: VOC family protein [Bacteroidetes bacterium]|nr:VOC family protein [Bacteroidota bacterium]
MLKTSAVTTILPVSDLERASDFYENILGLLPKGHTPEGNLLYSFGEGFFIALSKHPDDVFTEYTALSFEVEDLDEAIAELKEKGISFIKYPVPDAKSKGIVYEMQGEKAAWFKDTEGNVISIHQLVMSSLET